MTKARKKYEEAKKRWNGASSMAMQIEGCDDLADLEDKALRSEIKEARKEAEWMRDVLLNCQYEGHPIRKYVLPWEKDNES